MIVIFGCNQVTLIGPDGVWLRRKNERLARGIECEKGNSEQYCHHKRWKNLWFWDEIQMRRYARDLYVCYYLTWHDFTSLRQHSRYWKIRSTTTRSSVCMDDIDFLITKAVFSYMEIFWQFIRNRSLFSWPTTNSIDRVKIHFTLQSIPGLFTESLLFMGIRAVHRDNKRSYALAGRLPNYDSKGIVDVKWSTVRKELTRRHEKYIYGWNSGRS